MELNKLLPMLSISLISMVLLSCGGKKESMIAKVKPEKIEITGDLADYLQVVDNEYEIVDDFGGKLSIKIKALKALPENELNNDIKISVSILGENGMPVSGTGEFEMFKSSKEKIMSLLKKGNGEEVIELGSEITQYDAAKHASKSKKFVVSGIFTKNNESNSATSSNSNTSSTSNDKTSSADETLSSTDNNTSSTDCDKFMKDYEDFINSYIKLIKKYKANPTDATILNEYTEEVEKATKMETNVSLCTDAKYAAKLIELQAKLTKAAF